MNSCFKSTNIYDTLAVTANILAAKYNDEKNADSSKINADYLNLAKIIGEKNATIDVKDVDVSSQLVVNKGLSLDHNTSFSSLNIEEKIVSSENITLNTPSLKVNTLSSIKKIKISTNVSVIAKDAILDDIESINISSLSSSVARQNMPNISAKNILVSEYESKKLETGSLYSKTTKINTLLSSSSLKATDENCNVSSIELNSKLISDKDLSSKALDVSNIDISNISITSIEVGDSKIGSLTYTGDDSLPLSTITVSAQTNVNDKLTLSNSLDLSGSNLLLKKGLELANGRLISGSDYIYNDGGKLCILNTQNRTFSSETKTLDIYDAISNATSSSGLINLGTYIYNDDTYTYNVSVSPISFKSILGSIARKL